jgi:HD-GYP domain-containing protein (c-di-GMP phosphodiesterase class II)
MVQTQTLQSIGSSSGMSSANLTGHLRNIHGVISSRYPAIDRVALAAYDAGSDTLKTFVSSNTDGIKLDRYDALLSQVPSLLKLANTQQCRVVNDIEEAFEAPSQHTAWVKSRGFRSSFTTPIYRGDKQLAGFLFFDSREPHAFDPDAVSFLEMFGKLISQLYLMQLQVVNGIVGTVHVASGLARIRDLETGQHLERMAAYSRLMARELAVRFAFDDEFIEYVFLFAPLHDIGKVGIPDRVLLKPGKLDADEWLIMRRHVEIGETICAQITHDLGLDNGMAFGIMRNIVGAHHERGDGSGYPRGLHMADIPMEARIVAVADVYDALSNRRPYKQAWTEEDTTRELDREVASGRLDGDCVAALMGAREARLAIQLGHPDR